MSDIIGRSDEAAKNVSQSIRKVRGVFTGFTVTPSQYNNDSLTGELQDAVILEMEEGVEEPEMRDDTFRWYVPGGYPKGGAAPGARTFFVKGICASAETLCESLGLVDEAGGKGGWRQLVGQVVVLEWINVFLWKRRKDGTNPDNPEYDENYREGLTFASDGEEDVQGLNDHVRGLIVGKNKQAALRAVMLDARAKSNPSFKEGINTGAIEEMVGVVVDDGGIYRESTWVMPDANN